MAQSDNGPTIERVFGGRVARATIGADLTWSVVVTGGPADFDAKIADALRNTLDDWSRLFLQRGAVDPAFGEPINAVAAFVASQCGWSIVDAAPGGGDVDDAEEREGIKY